MPSPMKLSPSATTAILIPTASVNYYTKSAALGLSIPITLVLDNARYQKCKLVQELADSLGIELLYLPSYSPNLNLIERLWKYAHEEMFVLQILS